MDLDAVTVGRREDGYPWLLQGLLHVGVLGGSILGRTRVRGRDDAAWGLDPRVRPAGIEPATWCLEGTRSIR